MSCSFAETGARYAKRVAVIPDRAAHSAYEFHQGFCTRMRVPAARGARVVKTIRPQAEGAGKAGCPEHPQPVCIGSKHTVVTTSTPEITRLSPRNGFNGFLRALVSAKSARMCERAVLSKPPVAGSEPVRARRSESLPGSEGQIHSYSATRAVYATQHSHPH